MFILASQSPIRKKILTDLQYNFKTVPSNSPEFFNTSESVEENAMRLALEKAQSVQKKYENEIIVGSDSIMVDPFGKFLEKPKNKEDARKMIENRSGKTEIIVSGLAVIYKEKIFTDFETTTMKWKNISKDEIDLLLETNEWKGKCGGVMIEGVSGLFIEKIEGSLTNIMGFALQKFKKYYGEIKNTGMTER